MKKILFSSLLFLCFGATFAQWTFTIHLRYSGDCANTLAMSGVATSYEAQYKNLQIPTKSECESVRSQIANIREGYGNCQVYFVCGPCTGHDISTGGVISSDPNITSTLFQQGTAITPHNRANEVSTWEDEYVKKWKYYLKEINDYINRFPADANSEYASFDDYLNSVYGQIGDYSYSDRNDIKRADDSTYVYMPIYKNDNDLEKEISDLTGEESGTGAHIDGVVVEKVPANTTIDENDQLHFNKINNNNNFLPDLEDKQIDEVVYIPTYDPENQSESILGNAIEWVGEKWNDWNVSEKLTDWGLGKLASTVEDYAKEYAKTIVEPDLIERGEAIIEVHQETAGILETIKYAASNLDQPQVAAKIVWGKIEQTAKNNLDTIKDALSD